MTMVDILWIYQGELSCMLEIRAHAELNLNRLDFRRFLMALYPNIRWGYKFTES